MMKIVPAFLVQNSDGIPLRTFTVEADAQCWLNKLSAAVAREHHDDGGEPTERRQTVSRAVCSAQAKHGAWAWQKTHRGARRRREDGPPPRRKEDRWGIEWARGGRASQITGKSSVGMLCRGTRLRYEVLLRNRQ